MQLYDAQLRCALIEAETREEVMIEMEERMQSMENMFTKRLMRVVSYFEYHLATASWANKLDTYRWNTTRRGWTPSWT